VQGNNRLHQDERTIEQWLNLENLRAPRANRQRE
jgi:hypothetical protein